MLVAYEVALQALVQDRNIALCMSTKVIIFRLILELSKYQQQVGPKG